MMKLIHAITNSVNKKLVADLILSLGHSVIMADAPEETAEVTAQSDALLLNLGTPTRERYEAARRSAEKALECGLPYLLDPVGIGVSSFRREHTRSLFHHYPPTILRGNQSELISLSGADHSSLGVDASPFVDDHDADEACLKLAKIATYVIMTGPTDRLCQGEEIRFIHGGSPYLRKVSGMGDCLDAFILTQVLERGLSLGTLEQALVLFKEESEAAEKRSKGITEFTSLFLQSLLEKTT